MCALRSGAGNVPCMSWSERRKGGATVWKLPCSGCSIVEKTPFAWVLASVTASSTVRAGAQITFLPSKAAVHSASVFLRKVSSRVATSSRLYLKRSRGSLKRSSSRRSGRPIAWQKVGQ